MVTTKRIKYLNFCLTAGGGPDRMYTVKLERTRLLTQSSALSPARASASQLGRVAEPRPGRAGDSLCVLADAQHTAGWLTLARSRKGRGRETWKK